VRRLRRDRAALLAALALAIATMTMRTRAQVATVPVDLQVQLLRRVTRFERSYASSTEPAPILLVIQRGNVESTRVAAQLTAQLNRAREIGGRRVVVSQHDFTSPASLAAVVERDSIAIVYLTPGLEAHVGAIATAMANHTVLTVSAVDADAGRGAVLSFELVSSRPRIAINLTRARAQNLEFNALLLQIARVIR
jgi:hypothetical protein